MKDEDMTTYEKLIERLYDGASDNDARLDVIIKEYYITAFGNGLEAYNMYRRTGMPLNMAPSLQEGVGDFPRSMRYPNAFVDRNSSVPQKTQAELVFWDDGSTTLR